MRPPLSLNRQLANRNAGGSRTRVNCFAGSRLTVWLQRHKTSSSGIGPDLQSSHRQSTSARIRTMSASFGGWLLSQEHARIN